MRKELNENKEKLALVSEEFFNCTCSTYSLLIMKVKDLLYIYNENPTSILNLRIQEECKAIEEGIVGILTFARALYSDAIISGLNYYWCNKTKELDDIIKKLANEYDDLIINKKNVKRYK